jgi:hypothetical protein
MGRRLATALFAGCLFCTHTLRAAPQEPVGKAASESTRTAASNKWVSTGLALAAVVVAVVVIVCIANHDSSSHNGNAH